MYFIRLILHYKLIMKNKSSYQKLKDKVIILEHEIYVLVKTPESIEANEIKTRRMMGYDLIDIVMNGKRTKESDTMQGFYPTVVFDCPINYTTLKIDKNKIKLLKIGRR